MLTIEYCQEGRAINDFELDDWFYDAIRHRGHRCVSTYTAVDRIRLGVACGEISHLEVTLILDGTLCDLDCAGTPIVWPPGFSAPPYTMPGALLKAMARAYRQERDKR